MNVLDDWEGPLARSGKGLAVADGPEGLRTTVALPDTIDGRRVRARVEAGELTAFSAAFQVLEEEWPAADRRIVRRARLVGSPWWTGRSTRPRSRARFRGGSRHDRPEDRRPGSRAGTPPSRWPRACRWRTGTSAVRATAWAYPWSDPASKPSDDALQDNPTREDIQAAAVLLEMQACYELNDAIGCLAILATMDGGRAAVT